VSLIRNPPRSIFVLMLQIVKRMNQGILIGGVSRSIGATTFTDWLSR
jgi:hypothetical protein